MIERTLQSILRRYAEKFPAIALTGPRQSGKTTLVRKMFPTLPYVSLEDFDVRLFAEEDPKKFLETYAEGAIFDEVQKVPSLFSYLQTYIDEKKKGSPFILTGSQNFLLHEKISQTLAGRIALLKLLPLSFEELQTNSSSQEKDFSFFIFQGGYPRLYDKKILPQEWYPSYIQTYLERDVRQLKNVADLHTFQKFLKLCAGRIGQLLNLSSLAQDCGVSHSTARAWISVLEASYVIFLLHPHHKNWKKRIIKMPKLYFYDTGVACSLLGLEEQRQLGSHYLFGGLFENFIILELMKARFHRGKESNCFFWRDKTGHEIDCVLERPQELIPVEIKSGTTIGQEYFQNLTYWNGLSKNPPNRSFVVYGGEENQKRSVGNVVSWKNAAGLNV